MIESVVRNVVDSADSSALRGGVGGGGAPPALDIRASVGTSTSPTSTGTKAVTGVGFTPKVVLPFGIQYNNTGPATHAVLSVGAMTIAAQALAAVSSKSAATTSATHRRHDNSKSFVSFFDNAIYADEAYSSFGSDGFSVLHTKYLGDTVNYLTNHIALGGADLEVSLTQQQMNGTNAGQQLPHGLVGGAPTGLLFFACTNAFAPADTRSNLFMSIGAFAGSSQFGASIFSESGQTTTKTRRRLATSAVVCEVDGSAVQRAMAVSSVDATNVNVTYPTSTSSYQQYIWMVAFRGAKCQVGTFDCNGSTSPLTIATTGITPKLFLPVFVKDGVDSVGTVLNDIGLTIGASDGTNNVSCGIGDMNGATTTNARRWQSSTALAEYNPSNGVKLFEGTAAFNGESIVLTPATNTFSNWGQGGYLVIGS